MAPRSHPPGLLAAGCLLLAMSVAAQQAPPSSGASFPPDQLEQLVAPVALYPDALLTQVLMAATYPLEIVQAARWATDHQGLSGDALDQALQPQAWDASVKSLCAYPQVLSRMNEDLDWTQDLGDAVLGQQQDVLDAVQRMRQQAQQAGNLASNDQQQVTQDGDTIVVQPASSDVMYVPVYSPRAVYGTWGYPTWRYPSLYGPPAGVGVSYPWGPYQGAPAWGRCDWHGGDLTLDVDRYNTYVSHTCLDADRRRVTGTAGRAAWTHDPAHRAGVNYRDPATARRYGDTRRGAGLDAGAARGRGAAGVGAPGTPATREPGGLGGVGREGLGEREGGLGEAGRTELGSGAGRSSLGSREGHSALSGARNAGFDRSASMRGQRSFSRGFGGRGGFRR